MKVFLWTLPVFLLMTQPALAQSTQSNPCSDSQLTSAIPEGNGQRTGSAITSSIPETPEANSSNSRDTQLVQEVACGNIPNSLRTLVPVNINRDGTQVTICVMPDYLSFGNDSDNFRMPLGLTAAQQLATQMNMMLPTPAMVDAIYQNADVKLPFTPQTETYGAGMEYTSYINRHDRSIDTELAGLTNTDPQNSSAPGNLHYPPAPGSTANQTPRLVAGHKKDVVLTNRSAGNPNLPIYGGYFDGGRRVQPLSLIHGTNYADYSQGIRFVSQTAFVNGQSVPLPDILDGTFQGHGADNSRSALAGGENRISRSLTERYRNNTHGPLECNSQTSPNGNSSTPSNTAL